MTTPDGSRGGSVPPRPRAGKPQQWFVLRPWVFDVTLAGALLRAAPRPPVPIPVEAWARAYGLDRDPDTGRHAISLIGPGPDFSPGLRHDHRPRRAGHPRHPDRTPAASRPGRC